MTTYPSVVIENASVVTPDTVLEKASIRMDDGRISELGETVSTSGAVSVDANGGYVLPGLIDVHSDALEKAIAVRPSAPFPPDIALYEFDKTLAGCGITSMFYCVSFMEGNQLNPQRSLAKAREHTQLISEHRDGLMTNGYIHARLDLPTPEAMPAAREAVDAGQVHMLSLNDHTPGQGQNTDLENFLAKRKMKNPDDQLTAEALQVLIDRHEAIDYEVVREVVSHALENGVPVASHDDDSAEIVQARHDWGVDLAEFPVNDDSIGAARQLNMHTVLGSPNVLRGMSHGGNISARDAVADNRVDCICSDYAPMSMLQSLFCLYDLHMGPLAHLVNLYTLNPAKAAGLGDHTGSLEVGKDADVILVRPSSPVTRLEMTFVRGRPVVTHAGEWRGSVVAAA